MALDERERRRGVLDTRGHRDRDRQDVVDQQGAGDGDPGGAAEVDRRHLVVAAPARVGVHVLPVGGHHGEHHQRDDKADLPAVRVQRGAGHREHDEHLVGRIGDRRQRVTGEDGQGNALREQRLPELRAPELATEDDALRNATDSHEEQG
jgi:hypothetical protein